MGIKMTPHMKTGFTSRSFLCVQSQANIKAKRIHTIINKYSCADRANRFRPQNNEREKLIVSGRNKVFKEGKAGCDAYIFFYQELQKLWTRILAGASDINGESMAVFIQNPYHRAERGREDQSMQGDNGYP